MKVILVSVCILITLHTSVLSSDTEFPDSLLTLRYAEICSFKDESKALRILDEIKKRELAEPYRIVMTEGLIYYNTWKYRLAVFYLEQSLEYEEMKNNPQMYIEILRRVATCYHFTGNLPKAMEVAGRLLEVAKANGDNANIGAAYQFIGRLAFLEKDRKLAFEYFDIAERYLQESGDEEALDWFHLQVIDLMLENDLFDERVTRYFAEMEEYNKKAETSIGPEDNEGFGVGQFYAFASWALAKMGRKDEAAQYYAKFQTTDLANIFPHVLLIGRYLLEIEKPQELIPFNRKKIEICREQGDTLSRDMIASLNYLRKAYTINNDKDSALYFANGMIEFYRNKAENEQRNTALELAALYNVQEKESRLHASQTRVRIISYAAGICIILLIVITYLYRRKSYAYKMLAERAHEWAIAEENQKENEISERSPSEKDREIMSAVRLQMTLHDAYRNSDLTAESLADELGLHRNALSRAVNIVTGKNFNRYVNEFRIKEAVRLLSSPDNQLYMDELYEMVGFSSRTSFYRAFKQITGLSPTEYRKNS